MSDRRQQIREWLEFAAEMGIDALPRPAAAAQPAPVAPAASAADAAVPAASPAPAPPAAPPPAIPVAPHQTPAAEPLGAEGATPLERMRRMLGGKAAPAPRPAAASVPAAAPAAPPAAPATARTIQRLELVPAELVGGSTPSSLEDVRAEIGDCQRCRLAQGRTNIVFGSGNPHAELMFVGEGPGREEDLQGFPFVGKAGQLLTEIIRAIGKSRDEVYICNVVKCRPPENRTPEPDEVESCRGFLFQQLQVVRPRVVVALGKPAAETLLRMRVSITAIRGQEFNLFGATLVPTFHPAYLLRNPAAKREVWEDMKKVRDLLAASAS